MSAHLKRTTIGFNCGVQVGFSFDFCRESANTSKPRRAMRVMTMQRGLDDPPDAALAAEGGEGSAWEGLGG